MYKKMIFLVLVLLSNSIAVVRAIRDSATTESIQLTNPTYQKHDTVAVYSASDSSIKFIRSDSLDSDSARAAGNATLWSGRVFPADGTNNQVLTTDGAGSLFFSDKEAGVAGTINSLNGSSETAQTLVGDNGITVVDSGTGNYIHKFRPSVGRIIPTGSGYVVDSAGYSKKTKDHNHSIDSVLYLKDSLALKLSISDTSVFIRENELSGTQPLNENLTAISELDGNTDTGLVAITGSGTVAVRAIETSSSDAVSISNGYGVSDNPTINVHPLLDSVTSKGGTGFLARNELTNAVNYRFLYSISNILKVFNGTGETDNPYLQFCWPDLIDTLKRHVTDSLQRIEDSLALKLPISDTSVFIRENELSGTSGYILKFTGLHSAGNSNIYDGGTNIGIGTTSPQYKLDVRNGAHIETNSNTLPFIVSRKYKASKHEEIRFGVDDVTTNFVYYNDETSSSIVYRLINTDTETGGGASASDRSVLKIGSTYANGYVYVNGLLGIGTESPDSTLTVNGSGHYTGNFLVDGSANVTSTVSIGGAVNNAALTINSLYGTGYNGAVISSSEDGLGDVGIAIVGAIPTTSTSKLALYLTNINGDVLKISQDSSVNSGAVSCSGLRIASSTSDASENVIDVENGNGSVLTVSQDSLKHSGTIKSDNYVGDTIKCSVLSLTQTTAVCTLVIDPASSASYVPPHTSEVIKSIIGKHVTVRIGELFAHLPTGYTIEYDSWSAIRFPSGFLPPPRNGERVYFFPYLFSTWPFTGYFERATFLDPDSTNTMPLSRILFGGEGDSTYMYSQTIDYFTD